MSTNHQAHPACFGGEPGMAENSADEMGGFHRGKVQPYKAVSGMTQTALEKVLIAGKKGGLLEPVQQRQNIVISDAQVCYILSNNPAVDAPTSKQVTLIERDVFVQEIHAALEREASLPSSSSKAWRASCTASVTAALQIFPPPQRCKMKSHDNPRSTSARTSATKTRVPLKVGFPWQIAGSATM